MDEHIILDSGDVYNLENDFVDENQKDLTFWTNKHSGYAVREVQDILHRRAEKSSAKLYGREKVIRWVKWHVYDELPLFVRPVLYWFY